MYAQAERYFKIIEDMKYNIDAFVYNQRYVICKHCSNKDYIDYKYDRR